MPPGRREPLLFVLFAALCVFSTAAAFYLPALARAPGHFPVPLDDVYIHFAFARSAALGHPFAWLPDNGYSSGCTSLTYPLVLAPAWLLGLRGEKLGVFAALLACACLIDLARSLRTLLADAPRFITWTAPLLLLAVPLLDWSLFSGMETALLAALLGRALLATHRARSAPPTHRARAQLAAGLYAALLVATRPETAPLALLLALATAHAARSLALTPSLARAFGPPILFLAAQALANRALTGEWSAAGAVRKLISVNPYIGPLDVAVELIKNLIALRFQALGSALGGAYASWIIPLLGLVACLDRRRRALALPLFIGAYAALFLASLNATARFQTLRYAAPSLLMLLIAALLGAAALARRGRAPAALAALALLAAILAPARWFPKQIDHFARASANIAGQQVEVARRLAARTPRPRRVLLNDAGAIPYLSGLGAIDGLGLGGYHDLPFARASVHGVPAVVELIERLPPIERPDLFALYPGWWQGLADVFGRKIDAVTIEDNVICGAAEKAIYEADWSALSAPSEHRPLALDSIDVADLVDERAHAYRFPTPRGGWVIGAVLADADGRPRFDAGRIIPQGKSESFRIANNVPRGSAALVLRTDAGGPGAIVVSVVQEGRVIASREAEFPERAGGRWSEITAALDEIGSGDRVEIFALRGAFRSFHAWLVRE